MQEGPLMNEQRGGKEGLSKRLWNGGQILGRKPASCCCGGNGQRDMAQSVPRSQALQERNPHYHKKELQSQICLGVPGVSKQAGLLVAGLLRALT